MPVRKFARIVGAALRDADLARKTSTDPKWRREQMQDRRGTLRRFETVEHALQDRERSKTKPKPTPKPKAKPKKPKTGAKKK